MPLDADIQKAYERISSQRGPITKPAIHDISSRRRIAELVQRSAPKPPGLNDVEITDHFARSADGHDIPVFRFRKKGLRYDKSNGPAIVFCHGGGLFTSSTSNFEGWLAKQTSSTGIQIFSVDYRLAPENPYPIPLEDCYTALTWLHEHAVDFNVDPARIAIMGSSAGGCLAAAVNLLAKDRGLSPPLAKQFLFYPMLDDSNIAPQPDIEPFTIWNHEDNITAWSAYLGAAMGTQNVPPYAAPARVETMENFPPTYMEVGTMDFFRDEVIQFAQRAAKAGVDIEFHLYPGVPHSFEHLFPDAGVTAISNEILLRALKMF